MNSAFRPPPAAAPAVDGTEPETYLVPPAATGTDDPAAVSRLEDAAIEANGSFKRWLPCRASVLTVTATLCLFSFAAVCAGFAILIVSLTGDGGGDPSSTDGPVWSSQAVQQAQEEWLKMVDGGGYLPVNVSETILLHPRSPQAKALRWLALHQVAANSASSTETTETTTTPTLPLAERYALAVLYYHWAGPLWKVPANEWTLNPEAEDAYSSSSSSLAAAGSASFCSWTGITCSSTDEEEAGEDPTAYATVVAFNLTHNSAETTFPSFAGTTLPSELGLLTNLLRLGLVEHGLEGDARALGQLTQLVELDLRFNQLTSVLPHLTQMEDLEIARLSNNRLQDVVQDAKAMRKLRKVRIWHVDNNPQLTITAEFSFMEYIAPSWRYLEELQLSFTNVYFKFTELTLVTVWPNLRVLHVKNAPLDGTIPYKINALTLLEVLVLSTPSSTLGLVGEVMPDLGALTMLQRLELTGNSFESTIPTELGRLTALRELYLNGNQGLVGPIPTQFGNLVSLEIMKLIHTRLSGQIPSELGKLGNLVHAELQDTRFTGSVPSEMCANDWKTLMADCPIGGTATPRTIDCDCCTSCFGNGNV